MVLDGWFECKFVKRKKNKTEFKERIISELPVSVNNGFNGQSLTANQKNKSELEWLENGDFRNDVTKYSIRTFEFHRRLNIDC